MLVFRGVLACTDDHLPRGKNHPHPKDPGHTWEETELCLVAPVGKSEMLQGKMGPSTISLGFFWGEQKEAIEIRYIVNIYIYVCIHNL